MPGLFPLMKGELSLRPLTSTETQLDFCGVYEPNRFGGPTAGCPSPLRWPSSSTSSRWHRRSTPPRWASAAVLPLALLLVTGLYLFVLPYATKWRSERCAD
jgi:hypothetical protein